jgi:hypothetical protein
MRTRLLSARSFTGPATLVALTLLAACQSTGSSTSVGDDTQYRSAPAATDRTRTDVPTGTTGGSSESGSTAGPHEGTRASTPPGTSRDGQPPVGGAIVDPSGAVTGRPPPPGMR